MDEEDHHLCYLCKSIIVGLGKSAKGILTLCYLIGLENITVFFSDNYVNHRKNGCNQITGQEEQQNHFPHFTVEGPVYNEPIKDNLGFGFPTATQALANESEFMANIGLYPSLNIPRIIKGNASPFQDRAEVPDSLIWNDLPSSSKSPISQQKQLLLSKSSVKSSSTRPLVLDENYSDSANVSSTNWPFSGLDYRRKLWHPDQETQDQENGDDLWNDILSSAAAAADMYLNDDGATPNPNDPTLIEEAFNSPGKNVPTSQKPVVQRDQLPAAEKEYYCEPCNRYLCNADSFFRHNLSELHFKRKTLLQSSDLPNKSTRNENVVNKIVTEAPAASKAASKKSLPPKSQPLSNSSAFQKCVTCLASVPHGKFGKHLVSHFHHHRSINHPLQNELILQHINEIVKQAPFQCYCGFFFNFHKDFVIHFNQHHTNSDGLVETRQNTSESCRPKDLDRYWCVTCHWQSATASEMKDHLQSENHLEIVSMINRSVPITIKKITLVRCEICDKKFRLQINLVHHMKAIHSIENHANANEYHKCKYCQYKSLSKACVKKHFHLVHKKIVCYTCDKAFANSLSLEKHKNSQTHLEKRAQKGRPQACYLCGLEVGNQDIKGHLVKEHPSECSQCVVCGQLFGFSQELSAHVRKCKIDSPMKIFGEKQHLNNGLECRMCPFVAKSQDLLLLHSSYVHSESPTSLLSCSLCKAGPFPSKSKLNHHLLTHSDTQTRCQTCSALFRSLSVAQNHICSLLSRSKSSQNKCPHCGYTTSKTSALKSHLLVHQTRRQVLSCHLCSSFKCSRKSELNRHIGKMHQKSQERFKCDKNDCLYSTTSRQHLTRHVQLVHKSSDGTLYHCQLCSYTSLTMDNLRKHILKTTKHPGKSIYNCSVCDFHCNLQVDFRSHLLKNHPELDAESIVESYFLMKPNFL